MDLNQQRLEIEQFLLDVRQHIRASLETSEYENTSNIFHVTEAQSSIQLLQKCDQLLEKFFDKNRNDVNGNCNATTGVSDVANDRQHNKEQRSTTTTAATDINRLTNGNAGGSMSGSVQQEDVSYLDMTAGKNYSASREYTEFKNSPESEKSISLPEKVNGSSDSQQTDFNIGNEKHDTIFDEDPGIYDICQVTSANDADETQKPISADHDHSQLVDCPYVDLPAGHLTIQQSTKYGQLQRIEKRLFFDQSKKYYCGILNDWLLCYADGPTASRPSITLHLKSHGIEIEHSGEGKRREICFQITTADPNKKFTFQANNEVDAKEWIHAIEAAIRGDCAEVLKNARKLPTPPVIKRLTFICNGGRGDRESSQANANQADCIYEEPSPLYHVHEPTELLISKSTEEKQPPALPDKLSSSTAMARKYEYDVPKCPPQPLQLAEAQTELETAGLLSNGNHETTSPIAKQATPSFHHHNNNSTPSLLCPSMDFQTKVKDLHSKLSSQLTAGPLQKKPAKKTYSSSEAAPEPIPLVIVSPTSSPPSAKELKKQKKSSTPSPTTPKTAGIGKPSAHHSSFSQASGEKSAKNWFLNRLNKTTSSTRSSHSSIPSPAKCKQSEKENLLSNLEVGDSCEGTDSTPASPILKSSAVGAAKSKVNMIINQFESSGHLAMFSMEALAGNAVATFSSLCDSDCNNYEPIMTISTPPSSFMKKV